MQRSRNDLPALVRVETVGMSRALRAMAWLCMAGFFSLMPVTAKAQLLHSGGWKRLQRQSVTQDVFNQGVSSVFGCSTNRIIDYYGMVENVGVIYPDCEYGNKHVPAFADVIIRDPLTLAAVQVGQKGLIQVCSVLPTSFPVFFKSCQFVTSFTIASLPCTNVLHDVYMSGTECARFWTVDQGGDTLLVRAGNAGDTYEKANAGAAYVCNTPLLPPGSQE